MPAPRASAIFDRHSAKRGFVKRVRAFANRAAALPGFPMLWIAGAVAALLMIVTGGFRTGAFPLGSRIALWAMLLGWNTLKWQLWLAFTVRGRRDWWRASVVGGVLLNLPLPFEIGFALAAVGVSRAPLATVVWGQAAAIAATAFAAMALIGWWLATRRPAPQPVAALIAPGGLLDRARVRPIDLLAVEAEDHYCRVHRRDGGSALVHYRFGDAMVELAGLDGAQVHRGAWVAAAAVLGGVRAGRRWRLLLSDGSTLPVSASHVAGARARGWLRAPAPKTGVALAAASA